MMKHLLAFCCIFFSISIVAQQAADYFPANEGFKWVNKITPLDSLQQPVDSLIRYRIDSFTVSKTYSDKLSKVILSKSGYRNDVLTKAYIDTAYISLNGTDSYRYFNSLAGIYEGGNFDSLISSGLFASMKGWYLFLRFGQAVNQNYTILTKDTNITIQNTSYPVRFEISGKRLNDESLLTEIGRFTCKKFSLKTTLGIKVFEFLIIPVATFYDTLWAAPNNWIVKSVIPSTKIDLSYVNLGTVNINGSKTEIIPDLPAQKLFSVSGILSYKNSSNTPLPGSLIYLLKNGITKCDSVFTGFNGEFQFNNVENGIYSLSVLPAVKWGGVNSTDGLLIRKYQIGEYLFDSLQQKAADVNGNSFINSTDALYIRRRVAGLDSTFAAGDWVFDKTYFTLQDVNLVFNITALCTGDVNLSFLPSFLKKKE